MIERSIRQVVAVELTQGDLSVLIDLLEWEASHSTDDPEGHTWSAMHDDLLAHLKETSKRLQVVNNALESD
jgi:hypothetical protein